MFMGCRHAVVGEGPSHKWGRGWHGGGPERWDNIKQGIKIDVDSGRQKGEKTPEEFWSRVWEDMKKDTGKTADTTSENTTTSETGEHVTRVPTAEMSQMTVDATTTTTVGEAGESETQVPSVEMLKELPRFLTMMMLMRRWEEIGKGTEPDKVSIDTWEEVKTFHTKRLSKESKANLEEMTQSGKEDEFWKEHYEQRKAMELRRHTHGDHRNWWYTPSNNKGDMHGHRCKGGMRGYGNEYPFGYNPESSEFEGRRFCRFSRRHRKPADEKSFYKEFDFCS